MEASELPSIADLDVMRSRQLRNLLTQKLGISSDYISRLLDRKELKDLAKELILEQRAFVRKQHTAHYFRYAVMIVLFVMSCYIFREAISEVLKAVMSAIMPEQYRFFYKIKLVRFHMKKWYWVSAIAMAMSVLIETACSLIQLSTLLSWVLSSDSPLRGYLFPTPSLPLSASTLLASSGLGAGALGGLGGFNLDLGPMFLLFALKWVMRKLEEFSSAAVLEHSRRRDERKFKKRARKVGVMSSEKVDNEADSDSDDGVGVGVSAGVGGKIFFDDEGAREQRMESLIGSLKGTPSARCRAQEQATHGSTVASVSAPPPPPSHSALFPAAAGVDMGYIRSLKVGSTGGFDPAMSGTTTSAATREESFSGQEGCHIGGSGSGDGGGGGGDGDGGGGGGGDDEGGVHSSSSRWEGGARGNSDGWADASDDECDDENPDVFEDECDG